MCEYLIVWTQDSAFGTPDLDVDKQYVAMADAASPGPIAHADAPAPETVNARALSEAIGDVLQGKDLAKISLGELRKQTSLKLGFPPDA